MNRWLRLAVFSLVGIVVSMIVLSFITPKGYNASGNMNNMSQPIGMQGMPMGNSSQSGMGMMPMGNMQQGSPSAMPMSNTSNMQQDNTPTMIMQKLNQIQMQLNQLEQMMNNSNTSSGSSMSAPAPAAAPMPAAPMPMM